MNNEKKRAYKKTMRFLLLFLLLTDLSTLRASSAWPSQLIASAASSTLVSLAGVRQKRNTGRLVESGCMIGPKRRA